MGGGGGEMGGRGGQLGKKQGKTNKHVHPEETIKGFRWDVLMLVGNE